MDPRLSDLYRLPQDLTEQDIYLMDLASHCAYLETQVRAIVDSLPPNEQAILESYLDARDELEFQSVKRALKIGKAHTHSRNITLNP